MKSFNSEVLLVFVLLVCHFLRCDHHFDIGTLIKQFLYPFGELTIVEPIDIIKKEHKVLFSLPQELQNAVEFSLLDLVFLEHI